MKLNALTIAAVLAAATAIPATATITKREMQVAFQDAAKASADTYCDQKDDGTSENRALQIARSDFIYRFADRTGTDPVQFIKAFRKDQGFSRAYWNAFNQYAYDQCPEYYQHQQQEEAVETESAKLP